ncbi:MAG TPA: hypothetical protein VF992_05435 [Thermoplasmata archaeon]
MQLALENRLNFYQRAGLAMVLTGSVMLFVVLAGLALDWFPSLASGIALFGLGSVDALGGALLLRYG